MNFYTNVKQWGNYLLVREVTEEGRQTKKVHYSPTMYTLCQKETPYTNLDGNYVAPVEFENIKEAKEFISNYQSQPHLIFGNDQFAYTYIADQYPKEVDYKFEKLLIYNLDMECESENGFPDPIIADQPILSITLKNSYSGNFYVWGVGEYTASRKDVFYKKCRNETELLLSFLEYWERFTPDIITGWNIDEFDMPYIYNRILKVIGEKSVNSLSPWGKVDTYFRDFQGQKSQRVNILGVDSLDYLSVYKKFTYKKLQSYSLDYVSLVELKKQKDKNPYDTFSDWYKNDFQSFIDYNIVDVELVDKLEDKLKLLELIVTMAYDAKINFEDVYSPVKMWDMIIYNFLRTNNTVIPQNTRTRKDYQYEGAYVKPVRPGRYGWTLSFDLDGLYPHLIIMYNISPETLLDTFLNFGGQGVEKFLAQEVDLSKLPEQNITVAPNGAAYVTDHKGFLPILMEKMYDERKVFKKKKLDTKNEYEKNKDSMLVKLIAQYENIQMAKKIALNSAYGAIGNENFRYFDIKNAEAITLSGQLSIRWIEKDVNDYMNKVCGTNGVDYIIAADTDSLYVDFDAFVEKVTAGKEYSTTQIVDMLDALGSGKMQELIDDSFKRLAEYVNAHTQAMKMKREVIADAGIWTAKKRYVLNVWDSEGVRFNEPDLKIMGLEAIKSSTPASCRENIIKGIKVLLKEDEKGVNDFIRDYKRAFSKIDLDEVAFPRSVGNIKKYQDAHSVFKKGTPMHMKGAILYNFLLKERGMDYKYPDIRGGDKIKYVHLKDQNPFNCNVIAYKTSLPEEFGIHEYIDMDKQFEKAFADPFCLVTNAVGMDIDRNYGTRATLDDFFS
jgi:DNA polymerase elongation subunit (family B)